MVDRSSNTQLLSFFTDLVAFGRLDLNPVWQRKSNVWPSHYKAFFIDSILRNYPFPSLLINTRTSDDGSTVYEVVDGKQRLTTILDFVHNKLATSDVYSEDLGAPQFFAELTPEQRKEFFKYQVTVEIIKDGTLEELRQAFERLNRNVARLNPQELRHAAFSGNFITLMEKLADDQFWVDIGVATPARSRRMLDVQFVSQLFLLTMHGIQDGDEQIDRYYADYDEEIPDETNHRRQYSECKKVLERLQEETGVIRGTRFSNLADLYSLWAAALELGRQGRTRAIDYLATAAALRQFAEEVNQSATEEASAYLIAARQGSNKGPNRLLRTTTILAKFQFAQ